MIKSQISIFEIEKKGKNYYVVFILRLLIIILRSVINTIKDCFWIDINFFCVLKQLSGADSLS